jgi:hypothetical protein
MKFRDREHFLEELNKSFTREVENLEELKKSIKKPLFRHGSTIHITKAVAGKGYGVEEHTAEGEKVSHENVPFQTLDSKMNSLPKHLKQKEGPKELLRMKDSKHEGALLYHSATVSHNLMPKNKKTGEISKWEKLEPHGKPHGTGSGKKEE